MPRQHLDMQGERFRPGHEVVDPRGRPVRQLLEEVPQVLVGAEPVLLGGLDDREYDGGGPGAVGGVGEEPVLAADHEGLDAALREVVGEPGLPSSKTRIR